MPTDAQAIAVSYLDPPPIFDPLPFVELDFESGPARVALGDDFAVVGTQDRLVVIDRADGRIRDVWVEAVPTAILAGPGRVIYGEVIETAPGAQVPTVTFVAEAIDGEFAGRTILSLPSAGHAAEPFDYIFEHSSNGVLDRWLDGTLVTPFVDTLGQPYEQQADDWARVKVTADDVVERLDGTARWHLQIERDPTSPNHLEDRAAPASTDTAIYMTWVGPRIGEDVDYGTPTVPAIAVLRRDGSGTWYRLPEGWQVGDSNKWGTLLMKSEHGETQLAYFDPTPELPI